MMVLESVNVTASYMFGTFARLWSYVLTAALVLVWVTRAPWLVEVVLVSSCGLQLTLTAVFAAQLPSPIVMALRTVKSFGSTLPLLDVVTGTLTLASAGHPPLPVNSISNLLVTVPPEASISSGLALMANGHRSSSLM